MRTCAWLRPALYSWHQKFQKEKKKGALLYSTFELLHPCPQHTAKGSPCAEISLQVVKRAIKQTPFDLYRPATGLDGVADNTNNLQKCYIYMLQNCCRFVAKHRASLLFLFCPFSVDPLYGFQVKQDRQCVYNLTWRRFRITIVVVEKQ